MQRNERERPNNRLEKGLVVGGPDAGVEPHAVMVEFGHAFIAVFAVHGLVVDAGLAYPTVFYISLFRSGCCGVEVGLGVRRSAQVLVEEMIDGICFCGNVSGVSCDDCGYEVYDSHGDGDDGG
jgi:hypothetical protein